MRLTDWTGELERVLTNWIGTCVLYQISILYTKCCVIWHQGGKQQQQQIICIDDVLERCSVLI